MAGQEGFGSWGHLAARFVGALSPAGPSAADEEWAASHLLPGERALWGQMSGPDRRHGVAVARDVVAALRKQGPSREVVAAALLHDVGKLDARLGTFSRVGVTLAAMTWGRERLVTSGEGARGRRPRRLRSRVAAYLSHDKLGARLLEDAGSDPLTVAWAREHHMPPERWTVEPSLAAVLKRADGD